MLVEGHQDGGPQSEAGEDEQADQGQPFVVQPGARTQDGEDHHVAAHATRNEVLIIQRIGNIVAHQTETIKFYDEGFIVDKNFRPAKFSLINPISNTVIQPAEVTIIKEKTRRFIARKVDWEKARSGRAPAAVLCG